MDKAIVDIIRKPDRFGYSVTENKDKENHGIIHERGKHEDDLLGSS